MLGHAVGMNADGGDRVFSRGSEAAGEIDDFAFEVIGELAVVCLELRGKLVTRGVEQVVDGVGALGDQAGYTFAGRVEALFEFAARDGDGVFDPVAGFGDALGKVEAACGDRVGNAQPGRVNARGNVVATVREFGDQGLAGGFQAGIDLVDA